MWIIIHGNPCDGFQFFGPYSSLDEAAKAGNDDPHLDREWWLAEVEKLDS